MKFQTALTFVALVLAGVISRWVPHEANFTALLAVAIYAGFVLPPALALVAPVLSAFLGDSGLGFHDGLWFVYLSLIPLVYLGRWLPKAAGLGGAAEDTSSSPGRLAKRILVWGGTGWLGALFFFVSTNLAVWWFSSLPNYPHTLDGLISCFVLAIPFFHNSLTSTLLFLGAFEVTRQLVPVVNARRQLRD